MMLPYQLVRVPLPARVSQLALRDSAAMVIVQKRTVFRRALPRQTMAQG